MRVSDPCGGGGGGGGDKEDMFEDPRSWPPGFRFHPTDEELILYYLKRKICRRRLKLNVIADIDVYKCVPEDLPGLSILKSGDRQWFFFTPRDRKYPNGARSNRATRHGYWKATGKDRNITWNSRSVGVKKTLVFYKGRAPSGERTDWVMHEYTMEEEEVQRCKEVKDCYALCKVFKKSGPGPKNGEQYGAPFREEDWVDDCESVENNKPHEDNRVLENGSATFDDFRVLQNGSASVDQFRMLQDTSASVDNFRVLQNVNTSADNLQVLQNTNAFADNLRVLQNGNNSADNLWVLQNNNASVDDLRVLQNGNSSVDNLLVLQNGNAFVKNDSANKCQPPLDDLDEFFREIDNVPILNQPADNGYAYMLSQIGFEEDSQSTMMGASPGEVISADPILCSPTRNQWNVQNSLNATQSALSRLPSYEAPEVTSSSNVLDQDPLNIEDVGYLEMNDLLSTPVRSSNVMNTCQSSHVEPMDSLGGPDFFLDASMLLQDIGTINQGAVVDPNFNNIGDVLSSRVNYQPPIELSQGDDISQIWVHDRRADIFSSSEPNQVVMAPPTSAAVALIHDCISTNPQCDGRENQDVKEDGDVDSWFSSAISAFLGSVPARPALASENVLNRAFERMSSFSRMTIAAKDTAVPMIVEPIVRQRVGRHGGFLFFSVLGVVCAILWMLMIGTAVKVVKAFIGKFISSL